MLPLTTAAIETYLSQGLNRSRITDAALAYHRGQNDLEFLRLIGRSAWIPASPIPLDRVRLGWNPWVREADGVALGELEGDTYASWLRLVRGRKVENRACYRLLEVGGLATDPILRFSTASYEGYLNTCGVRVVELAEVFMEHPGNPVPQERMRARGRPSAVFTLADRNAVAGVSTLTIGVNGRREPTRFLLHLRDGPVAEAGGTHHVIPAGTFQPDGYMDSHHSRDFRLSRTVLREFAEEFAGIAEAELVHLDAKDFMQDARMRAISNALAEGQAALWYLGLGLDPASTKPEILTALVVEDSLLDGLGKNWEGQGWIDSSASASRFEECATWPTMLSAGGACLRLAARALEQLCAKTPRTGG